MTAGAPSISRFRVRSRLSRKMSRRTGEASAAMPKAQGMAISILNLMVSRILYMTSVRFFWARERTILGIMEVPREEATATGTLESRRYLPP